jgi:hypothetical protein
MAWGYITVHGPRQLGVVFSHLGQHQYLQILNERLPNVINKYGMGKKKVIY